MGVDESEDGGGTTAAAAGEEGSQSLYRERRGGDLGGSGNWDRPGKKGEEEGRRKEEIYTWIDRVDGRETEVNPWRRCDRIRGHCVIGVLGWNSSPYAILAGLVWWYLN